jgi:hypothetical protein
VTHIVIPSWDDFTKGYGTILGQQGATPYLEQVLNSGEPFPRWLRPLYYPVPEAFGIPRASVTILAVLPGQSEFDAHLHKAIFYRDKGDPKQALLSVGQAALLQPDDRRVKGLQESLRALNPQLP